MILRVLGEGQYEIGEDGLGELNERDAELSAAVEGGDEQAFGEALAALLDSLRSSGRRLPDDHLAPSDGVLPGADTSLEEVRGMLREDGLIPG